MLCFDCRIDQCPKMTFICGQSAQDVRWCIREGDVSGLSFLVDLERYNLIHMKLFSTHQLIWIEGAKGPVAQWLQNPGQHLRSWIRLPMGANILGFNGVVYSVVGDVPVDSEAPVVTSSISRICRPSLRRWSQGQGLRTCIHRGVSECQTFKKSTCIFNIISLSKSTIKHAFIVYLFEISHGLFYNIDVRTSD